MEEITDTNYTLEMAEEDSEEMLILALRYPYLKTEDINAYVSIKRIINS